MTSRLIIAMGTLFGLAACGQPLTLPPVLEEWLQMASAHPDVERALAPWRAATQAWLAS